MIQTLSDLNSFIWTIIGIGVGFPFALALVVGAIIAVISAIGSIFYFIFRK